MRVRALHDFAVQFEHKAQHAVRRRVLWAEIHGIGPDLRLRRDLDRFRLLLLQGLRAHSFVSFIRSGPPSGLTAFSSPGSCTFVIPSHGETKSNVRKSCDSLTGSY